MLLSGMRSKGVLHGIEHVTIRCIADGVGSDSQPSRPGADYKIPQLFRLQGRDACVLPRALVRGKHMGTLWAQGTVGKELDSTYAQILVAQTRSHSQFQG